MNDMMKKIASMIILIPWLVACSTTTDSGVAMQGAGIGAILGGVVGALACGNNRAKCAAIGAGIGAVVGGAAGYEINRRRQQYASDEDFYNAQIASTTQYNQQLSLYNQQLRKSLQEDQQQIDRLLAQYRHGQASRNQLIALQQNIKQKLDHGNQELANLHKELEVQQGVVAQAQQNKSPQAPALQQQYAHLENQYKESQQLLSLRASQSDTIGGYL